MGWGFGRRGQRMQYVDRPADVQALAEPAGARRPCMNAHALNVVTCAQSAHGIEWHRDRWRYVGQRPTVRTSEPKRAVGPTLDTVSFFVHGAMVPATQKGEVGERGRPSFCPVADVVPLREPGVTARKATSLVAMLECPPQGRGNRSRPSSDFEHTPIVVVPHHHAARIASQAARRFCGNARAVLEDRLPRLIRIGQHGGIDVDHYLIALAGGAGIELLVKCRFRDQHQSIRLLLAHARWIPEWIDRDSRQLFPKRALAVEPFASRGQRLHEQRPRFRLESAAHGDHAVLVLVNEKRSASVPFCGFLRLGHLVHPSPTPHDPFDVVGGPRTSDRQQPGFGFGRGHAGQRSNFGVRQLSSGKGLAEERQRPECARDSHPLSGRPRIEPYSEAQPGGTRAEAGVPSRPRVELADQVEKVRGRGVEVSGELGDLVAEPVEIGGFMLGGHGIQRISLHVSSPVSAGATLHPGFRGPGEPRRRGVCEREMIFRRPPSNRATVSPCGPQDANSQRGADE